MLWWHVLLAIAAAVYGGKKIVKWLENPAIKKEFVELLEVIEEARRDGKITVDEIPRIMKEAVDVVRAVINK